MLIKTEKSKNGFDIISIEGKLIHSKFAPEKEASGIILEGKNVIVVFGIGLGYHIVNLINNNPDSTIIAYEPIGEVYDFFYGNHSQNIAGHQNVHLLKNIDENTLINILDRSDFLFEGRLQFYSNPGYKSLLPGPERDFFEAIKKSVEILTQNVFTESVFMHMWFRNFINNSLSFYKDPVVSFGKSALGENLAVIACAGPSLDKEMPSIRKFRESINLFAVDTAIKPLKHNGIKPDFVVSLDGQIHSYDDFVFDDNDETCYIFDTVSYPKAVRLVKNRMFSVAENIYQNSLIEMFFKESGINVNTIPTGGTVADYTLDICVKLGFKNIYFSGLDLSFPGLITHCKNSPFYEKAMMNSGYFDPAGSINARAISKRKLKVAEGKPDNVKVLSDFVLENYAFYISEYDKLHQNINIYNSNNVGLKISGLIETGLDELVAELDTKHISIDEITCNCEKHFIGKNKLRPFYDNAINSLYEISKTLKSMLETDNLDIDKYHRMNEYIFDTIPFLKKIVRYELMSISKKYNGIKNMDYYKENCFILLQTVYFFIRAFQKTTGLSDVE